ncbi:hypothetical protein C8R48DRAFT_672346 [Suillus tomentosus]|nr:hypothetical protein C8R48DRAFT_672346 [Suillus tomentosus]
MININLSIRLTRYNVTRVYARPETPHGQVHLGRGRRGRVPSPEVEVAGGDAEVPLGVGRWEKLKERFRGLCKIIFVISISERIDPHVHAERDLAQLMTTPDDDIQSMQGHGGITQPQVKNVEMRTYTSEREDVDVGEYDGGCTAGRKYEGTEACKIRVGE